MSFGQAIKSGFSNLGNFKGRARRSEFWWFYLFMVIVTLPLSFLISIPIMAASLSLGSSIDPDATGLTEDQARQLLTASLWTIGLSLVLGAIVFFLMLSVWVRRLHDAGYSGHFMWLSLIGLSIIPLILAILEGNPGPNRYGADPKALEREVWAYRQAGPVYGEPVAGPTPTPPPYVPPAAPVVQQPTQPSAPGDPASDPFATPPR